MGNSLQSGRYGRDGNGSCSFWNEAEFSPNGRDRWSDYGRRFSAKSDVSTGLGFSSTHSPAMAVLLGLLGLHPSRGTREPGETWALLRLWEPHPAG